MLHNYYLTFSTHITLAKFQYVSYVSQVLPNLKIRLKMFLKQFEKGNLE